jgi:hypothetical protein
MAQDTYLVTIGTIVLSKDGTDMGAACLTKVEGLSSLFLAHSGASRIALSGKPFNFTRESLGQGIKISIKPFSVTETVLGLLKTVIDTANTGNDVIPIVIANGPMAVNVDCRPLFEGNVPPIQWADDFFNTDLYNVELRFITDGFTA